MERKRLESNISTLLLNFWVLKKIKMNKINTSLEIKNIKGLHARAAASFVKTAELFDAEIEVSKDGMSVGGTSIMGLMLLSASKGTSIDIKVSGADAEKALEAITNLVNNKFGEE